MVSPSQPGKKPQLIDIFEMYNMDDESLLIENVTFPISTAATEASPKSSTEIIGALDKTVPPTGLRLWMLLAMVFGVLLLMMIIVCCFIKMRIPRTKREIELDAAARRKKRIFNAGAEMQTTQSRGRGATKVIVMSSIPAANQSLLSASSGGMEADFDDSSKYDDQERRRSGESAKIKV